MLVVDIFSNKLSAVILCGSMAVTLVGNSGAHAADEVAEGLKDSQQVEESASSEETDASGNQDVEDAGEEADASLVSSTVLKPLAAAALGVGLGVSADQIFQHLVKKGKIDEEGGSAAKKIDEESIIVNSPKFKELQDALARAEEKLSKSGSNVVVVDSGWGEAFSVTGLAAILARLNSRVRAKLKEKGISVDSNSSLVIMILFQALGLAFAASNVIELAKGKGSTGRNIGHAVAGIFLPPVEMVWECAEKVIASLGSGEKDAEAFNDIKALLNGKKKGEQLSVEQLNDALPGKYKVELLEQQGG